MMMQNRDEIPTTIAPRPEVDMPEILMEGWMLKQSRNNYWQDRYFVLQSDQTLSYRRKEEDGKPRVTFRISRESGCEISDVYVEQTRSAYHHQQHIDTTNNGANNDENQQHQQQHHFGSKEMLYCVNISWPDETETIAAYNDSFRDDGSYTGAMPDLNSRPSSPVCIQNGIRSPRGGKKKGKSIPKLKHQHSDLARYNAEESSVDSSGLSLPGKNKLSSILRRRHRRGHSTSTNNSHNGNNHEYLDDGSIASVVDPPKSLRLSSSTPTPIRRGKSCPTSPPSMAALGQSMPNIKLGESRSPLLSRRKKLRKQDVAGVPLGVIEIDGDNNSILELQPGPIAEVSESREIDDTELENLNESNKTERMGNLRQTLADEYGLEKHPSYEERNLIEQEKLHHEFLYKQRKKRSDTTKRVIGVTKIAVAASAAVGVGIITAGVGLAAGLVFLGGAAAIGGTAGVAEVGLKRTLKKKDHLTIATTNYELAKLWKSTLDACLEQESLRQSTWGQLYVADGRKPTSALIISAQSGDEDDQLLTTAAPRGSPVELQKGQRNLFLRNPNFLAQTRARWRPLEGGWISFLGPGAQCLRIFKEERIQVDEKSLKVAPLAVGGSTCTPLRTQVVLNAHPTEAFMCIMSYARMQSSDANDLSPNSDQNASFRLIEKIDDHTDVIHLVCRKLYLFPSWSEARDFVLLRYWRYEPDGSYIICYESMEHSKCPPQPRFVRGIMHHVYTIAPQKINDTRRKGPYSSNECMLTTVVQVDPRGWIPTRPMVFLSNQTYADAFGISALLQTLDIREAIENDRFLDLSPDLHYQIPTTKSGGVTENTEEDYDLRFVNRERCDSTPLDKFGGIGIHPEPLGTERWAEPDANSFKVRGPLYKKDRVKVNAGTSIGQLIAVDVVHVEKPIYTGMSMHKSERIQLALQREKKLKQKGKGKESDMPPFIFVVNIILPGPPFFHGVFYYAVDDMSTIDGSNGTSSSKLCQKFLFGDSDDFRDRTFKLIPRIVEGNFLVRKAVGNTPAIMGTKLKQYYIRNERFMELILDCGSSPVATGVIRLSLGYAKTLVVDMGFLLEADEEEYLPERIFGAVRVKYPSFGPDLRTVEEPTHEN